MSTHFDIIVVGGGHAGVEAAAVAARMGCVVALVTMDRRQVGAMSCNPAIGGIGKGHLVREVDALDGLLARAADAATIHRRMLNRRKGRAVWGPRVQADRALFRTAVQAMVADIANLTVIEGEVIALATVGDSVAGVVLGDGSEVPARAVVLATGTFLGARLFRGRERWPGGRLDEGAATRLADQLRDLSLPLARMKTGTPPRLDGRTIDWATLPEQAADSEPWTMSMLPPGVRNPLVRCAITRTTAESHDIIRYNLADSPLFGGAIGGVGPRYCPSIEDKVHRFGDRDGHQIFLEPESLGSWLVYPNGISTSLSRAAQDALVASLPGCADARIEAYGYAVEYDHIDPRLLGPDLQLRDRPGLFCAGQVNGTTGYEEAAAQGLVAGIGAARCVHGEPSIRFDRAESYIGVMVDDLTLQGVSEPYRMLTARAEHRLHLRADNAPERLTPQGLTLGCVGGARAHAFVKRRNAVAAIAARFDADHRFEIDGAMESRPLYRWVLDTRLPEGAVLDALGDVDRDLAALVEQDIRYRPYVERARAARTPPPTLPLAGVCFASIPGLSREMVERLEAARPISLDEASRIRGITPAALSALIAHAARDAAS